MTTRRTLLASLAVPAAMAIHQTPASGATHQSANPHPDAALLDLERRWLTANAAYETACDVEEALDDYCPPLPEALFLRQGDHALGLGKYATGRGDGDEDDRPRYCHEGGKTELRGWRRRHWKWEQHPGTGEDGTPDGSMIERRVPWLEAQARADEIAEAWDRWTADEKAARQTSGYAAAAREARRLGKVVGEIEREIEGATPLALEGLAVKARHLQRATNRGDEITDAAALIVRDILALAGGAA
ncbi:hypothetical protein R1A27_28295 [Methylobacterium sp. NMS12]|uniref:hypothetical protein n=1 Tax=Methylobacterium sp. NMS12 TaxID=3079766 RepID=UPI003F8809D0